MEPFVTWQLVDSAFPTGGFAHSFGLEAAWQQGEVADAADLRAFVRASVLQAGHASLPLVNAAHEAPDRLEALDDLNDAFLTNVVANRASRVQGRAWIATCARVWPGEAMAALDARASALRVHAAPVMGAALRTLDVPLGAAQDLVLYLAARGVVSAAVRLGVVGSYEAQRILREAAVDLDDTRDRCGRLDLDDLAQTAPVIDIVQAGHDRLYSRLFQS